MLSLSYELCGFVAMRGAGRSPQRLLVLHAEPERQVALRIDDELQAELDADAEALAASLRQSAVQAWSGILAGPGEPYDDLDLWLATTLPGYAVMAASRPARDRGIVASSPIGISAVINGGSFAYLAIRDLSGDRTRFEFGAYGHGPAGARLAEEMAVQTRRWGNDHRGSRAIFRADPAGTASDRLPAGSKTVDRPHHRITISWPATDMGRVMKADQPAS
ncbi:MAG TPA: hypothetical protein VFQ44_17300 [Streptosporangiaceae bacterium]|nr:hypothetical protein [Streptosporangiaceae bacterium]